jgi:hypothetical protein
VLAVAALALSSACAQDDGGSAARAAAAAVRPAVTPAARPAPESIAGAASPGPLSGNPYAEDVSMLRYRDPSGDETLVRSGRRAFIRVEEFNAWLGTYPLRITAADLDGARRQALEQMVRFKLLVESARQAGYEDRVGPGGDQKALALAYLRDQVSDVATISDAAADRYEAEHPELFVQLGADVPPAVRMMAIKGSIRSDQLRARIEDMEADAAIEYAVPLRARRTDDVP